MPNGHPPCAAWPASVPTRRRGTLSRAAMVAGLGGATFWDSLNEYLKLPFAAIGVQVTVEVGGAASPVQNRANWYYDLWVNWGSNKALTARA